MIAIWDLTTGEVVESLRLSECEFGGGFGFTSEASLVAGCSKGVMAWDFETGEHELLVEINLQALWASDDGRRLLVLERGDAGVAWDPIGSPLFIDLDTGVTRRLVAHGDQIWDCVLSADGTVVATGNRNGTIRVGLTTGEEPHVLLGHHNSVSPLAIDPLKRWIASGGHDDTIRLWPMPDLSKAPLHTLPREQLIAKLKTLTNIRLVRSPESSTGWKLTHAPFAGWKTAPSW